MKQEQQNVDTYIGVHYTTLSLGMFKTFHNKMF